MKVCVVSDLHCRHVDFGEESRETLLISNMPRVPVKHHPVSAMIDIAEKNGITADALVCLGDIGDRADYQGIISGWGFIDEIKRQLNAKICLGIPGNHDINSHKDGREDAFEFIKNFTADFPTNDNIINNKFWEEGYCYICHEESLFLLLNSVHNHYDEESSAKGSMIKPDVLDKIEREYDEKKYCEYNYKICLTHHHPIKHSNIKNYKDSDSIENGDELVEILIKKGFAMIMHGHKHQPRIVNRGGMAIFATGSFSSISNLQSTGLNTMFHLVDFCEDGKRGKIDSWEYILNKGWVMRLNELFPKYIGFGSDIEPKYVALKINELFEKGDGKPLLYDHVISEVPDVEFLMPETLMQLSEILKDKYALAVDPEYPLQPNKVIKLLV